jgi:hypothetical protein
MDNFLMSVEKNDDGFYYAFFSDGTVIDLDADNYADAICAADLLEIENV